VFIKVRNLPLELSVNDLTEVLSKFGPVARVKVGRDNGIAHIEMDEAGGREALSALNRSQLGGREIYILEVSGSMAGFHYVPGNPAA
jgi:RNA recognition motif-containing protein